MSDGDDLTTGPRSFSPSGYVPSDAPTGDTVWKKVSAASQDLTTAQTKAKDSEISTQLNEQERKELSTPNQMTAALREGYNSLVGIAKSGYKKVKEAGTSAGGYIHKKGKSVVEKGAVLKAKIFKHPSSLQEVPEKPDTASSKPFSLQEVPEEIIAKGLKELEGEIRQSLKEDGLMRLSGSSEETTALLNKFMAGETLIETPKPSVHVTVVAYKKVYMQLNLMKDQRTHYIQFAKEVNDPKITHEEKLNSIRQIVNSLPPQKREYLRSAVTLMKEIEQHSDQNKMTANNLAIVFGPNLLDFDPSAESKKPDSPPLNELMQTSVKLNDAFKFILTNWEEIQQPSSEKK